MKDKSTIENDRLKEMVEKQNNREVSSSVQIICKELDIDRQKSLINTDKKESLYEKLIDNEKEIIKKGMVKEKKEIFERQNSEDVEKVIKTNDRRRIERHKDEDVIRRKLEKEIGKDDSPRNHRKSSKVI